MNAYFLANNDVALLYAENNYGMTPDEFAQHHYKEFGSKEGRTWPGDVVHPSEAGAAAAPATSGGATAAPVASPPKPAKTYSNINEMYQDILGRDVESEGSSGYWSNKFGEVIDPDEVAEFQKAAQAEIDGRKTTPVGGSGNGLLSSATHSPNVVAGDTPDYFKLYADVAGLYETNNYGMSKKEYAAAHYQQHGKAEGRMPDTVYIAPNSTPGGGGGSKPGGGSTSSTSSTSSGGGSASSGGAASSAPVSFSVGAPSTPYKPYVAPAGSAGAAPYVTSQRAITALPGRDAYSGGARSAPAPQTPTPTTGANASGAPAMTPSKSTPSNPYGYAAGASPVAGQPIPPMPQPSTGMTDQQMQLQRQASQPVLPAPQPSTGMTDQEMQRQRQAQQAIQLSPVQPGTGMLYQSVPQSSSGYGPGGPEGVFDDDFLTRPQVRPRDYNPTGQSVPETPSPYLDTSRYTDFQGSRQPPAPQPSTGGRAPMPQPSSPTAGQPIPPMPSPSTGVSTPLAPVAGQPIPPMPAPSAGMTVRPAISQPLPTAGAVAPPMPQPSTGGRAPMPQPSASVAGQPTPPMPKNSAGTPEQEAMRSGRATPAQPTPVQPNTPPAANAVTLRNVNAAQETIEGRVGNLLGADAQGNYTNPVVRQAVDRAMQSFSGRGLLNSSMAQQAAFEAATAKAIEIAGPDAQAYFNQGRANQDASNVFARDAISNAHDKDKFDRQLEQSGSQFDRDFGLRGDQFKETQRQFDSDFGLRSDQFKESQSQFDRNIDLEGKKFNESQSQFDRDLELRGYQVNQSGSQFEKEFDLKTQTFNQSGDQFDKELTFKAQQAGVQAGLTQQEINTRNDQIKQNQVQFEANLTLQRDQLTQQGSQFNQNLENQQNEFKLTAQDKKDATALAHKYSLEISTNNAVHDSYNVYLRRLADIDGNKDLTAETKADQKNSAGKDFDTYAEKMAPGIKLELGNRFSVKPEDKPGDKTPTGLLSGWNDGSVNGP